MDRIREYNDTVLLTLISGNFVRNKMIFSQLIRRDIVSQPNLPNITPVVTLSRDDTINLLLSSIAMEELEMAHILNAEGKKSNTRSERFPD